MRFLLVWIRSLFKKTLIIHKICKLSSKTLFIFFSPNTRMSGKNIISNDKKINKSNFYKNKTLFSIYDIDVDKLLISKKECYGKKKLT